MRKYAPKMKEKAFLSILNKKFPGGACPRTPLAAWALRAQVTRPKGVYIRVTPVTTKATAVQNSTENPGDSLHNVGIEQALETGKNELGIGCSALLDAAEFGMVCSCSFTVYF